MLGQPTANSVLQLPALPNTAVASLLPSPHPHPPTHPHDTQAAPGEADESGALRKELLSDVAELRRLLDGYMGQLAGLTGAGES